MRVVDYTALLPTGAGTPSGGPESLELTIDGSLRRVSAGVWMDELEANGAEVLGRYRGQPFDGAPAVTMKRVGSGKVFYVGTSLDDAGQDSLMSKVLSEAKVSPGVLSPDNVEIVRRVYEGTDHWFILNHGPAPQEVTIPASGIDLLTGKALAGNITVNGLDALVVRSQSSP